MLLSSSRRLLGLQKVGQHLRKAHQMNSRGGGQNYEGPGKTTLNVLNEEVGSLIMIDGYSSQGFRLNNNMFVFGPMAVFPTCCLAWAVRGIEDITPESLALFRLISPKPDLVVIGIGTGRDGGERVDAKKYMELRKTSGLNVEMLPTEHAIASYNYMCGEGRAVAAALIPPLQIRKTTTHDYFQHRKNTYGENIWKSDDQVLI